MNSRKAYIKRENNLERKIYVTLEAHSISEVSVPVMLELQKQTLYRSTLLIILSFKPLWLLIYFLRIVFFSDIDMRYGTYEILKDYFLASSRQNNPSEPSLPGIFQSGLWCQ